MGRKNLPEGRPACPPAGVDAGSLLLIGKILKTKGVRGQVKALSFASSQETIQKGRILYVPSGDDGYRALAVETKEARGSGGLVVLKFRECNRMEEAEELVGAELYVDKGDLPAAAEDEYYWHELIGMDVVTEAGRRLGSVQGILQTGSNDVYVVREGEREILIPGLRDVVRRIDLAGRRMVIHPLEGLLDSHDL